MTNFDPFAIDLSGVHLVEASAGTGKTHAIASIYLRLLVEAGMGPESILVVTFTVAATDELKIRIRNRITHSLRALESLTHERDTFTCRLLESVGDMDRAVRILRDATSRLDEAAIHTIHGFCARVLSDMAFESASPFSAELVSDDSDMVHQAAVDFYRIHVEHASMPEIASFALHKGVTPGTFAALKGKGGLLARILPQGDPPDPKGAVSRYTEAFMRMKEAWGRFRNDVALVLADKDTFNQRLLKAENVPRIMDEVEGILGADTPPIPLPVGRLAYLTTKKLANVTKQGKQPPRSKAFELCDALFDAWTDLDTAMDRYFVGLKVRFLAFLEAALEQRKNRERKFHFDDLLLRVYRAAVSGSGGLVDAVRKRYASALIDEFQDTDRLQYEIFRRCFPQGPLFLIGDPKQAIYGFRGADIFAYREAARQVEGTRRHTLRCNHRSAPGLVHAVNTLFTGVERPFVFDWIRYEEVEPAQRSEGGDPRAESGCAPLEIVIVGRGEGGLGNSQAAVSAAVACEIVKLVSRGDGGGGTRPSDIAVLVRDKWQALAVKQALVSARIPCVLTSDEDVFDSREAFEISLVMDAIMEPRREGVVRCALLTRIFGLGPSDILALHANDTAWEEWMERFHSYSELWRRYGFIPMFRRLMDELDVRRRLLSLAGGERALTNVLHLFELIGEAEAKERLGMAGLRKWLLQRTAREAKGGDESQLRLETDEDAVRVMTVHKSKGLEFDVVFVPFAWEGFKEGKKKEDLSTFHCRFHDGDGWPVLDLGSDNRDEHRLRARDEEISEEMRVLYVALTRAKRRCYLLIQQDRATAESPCGRLFGDLPESGLAQFLKERIKGSGGHIALVEKVAQPPPPLVRTFGRVEGLSCRTFRGSIDRTWGLASYSFIVRKRRMPGRPKDVDGVDASPVSQPGACATPPVRQEKDIFAFPRGGRAGTVLHEIFEKVDFGWPRDAIEITCAQTLALYGFDASWGGVVAECVLKVLESDLEGVRLRDLPGSERVSEMEFFFPLKKISLSCIDELFPQRGHLDVTAGDPSGDDRFLIDEVSGFMRGYVDLVFRYQGKFYIIDWKSNHLGWRIEDYHKDSLCMEMARNRYDLQYHLYAVAVDRYLRRRMPGYSYAEHFGGVIYVFLRGVDPARAPKYGVFTARPDEEVLCRIADLLVDDDGGTRLRYG